MKRFKAAVVGGSGYGGGEIIRRLLIHPEIELIRVASIDYVGEPLSAAHPNLEGLSDLQFEDIPPEQAAKGADVVLLGLPHTVSSSFVPRLIDSGATIIDLSGDFRLKDVAAYERFYGTTHPCPELLERAVYGLPELNRAALRDAELIASPGCFATATAIAMLPFAKAGLLQGEARTVAATGSSGSGAAPKLGTHHPIRAKNLKTYKPLRHQHVPEIVQTLNDAGAQELTLHFAPVSAPLTRGIFTSTFLTLDEAVSEQQIADAYAACFEGEPFVRVPAGRLPEVAAVSGSNYLEVGFAFGDAHQGKRTVMAFSAIDNLIKGGAGQAVQSMNAHLGLDEGLTLRDAGGFP
jgi:N-acetyl-gamma-glutamyl-phosphate reductase